MRPKPLAEARETWRRGGLADDEIREIEDTHIRDAVALQEGAGLKGITDGEFRRDYWHLDFICGFNGIEFSDEAFGMTFSGGAAVGTTKVSGKIDGHSGFMRAHFAYLASVTGETAKFCIPAPGMVHMRGGRAAVSADIYPDIDEFWADLIAAYRAEVRALYDLGCRYLQFDDTSMAYLCDEDFRARVKARGDDADELIETYARATSAAISERPADMCVTTHMCRGNFKSTWMMKGGYAAVAETMFATLDVDAYFMEWDSDRAGDFEPLKYLPQDKIVVVGLITTKSPELESGDDIKRRIDEVAKLVPLERICISPQCGFASTHHGNELSEDDERRKLELVVRVADEVWG